MEDYHWIWQSKPHNKNLPSASSTSGIVHPQIDHFILTRQHLAGAKLPADPASQEPGKHSHIQPPQDRVSHPRTP
ncbi:hypothetical protein LEMLEM_LOCUS11408, partial [Lemmus lemmus]